MNLGKRIENRVAWPSCHYRGPLLLHVAKGCTADEYEDATLWMCLRQLDPKTGPIPKLAEMQSGGIFARCVLADVFKNERQLDELIRRGRVAADQRPWWMGKLGMVLADVEPLPFVPWKGALGLFEVPDDYASRGAP